MTLSNCITPLWTPTETQKEATHLACFMKQLAYTSYDELYQFSIDNLEVFWDKVWAFTNLQASYKGDVGLVHKDQVKEAVFYPQARLNYAENLLKYAHITPHESAIIFKNERGERQEISFSQLEHHVSQITQQLQAWGVKEGDVVAAYVPNLPQTVEIMLATATLGAIWSSCSPDFGVAGLVDRLGQLEPKVLIISDGYVYNGKTFNCLEKLTEIRRLIPSIEKVLVIPYQGLSTDTLEVTSLQEVYQTFKPQPLAYVQVSFNHPLFVMFSSGTTGIPKCIIHGTGGTLIQHLKEHQLHCDIHPGDRLFYFTTCGWMMWNWQVSALSSGATLMLYDGNPFYPNPEILWDYAIQEKITHFGTSAKYIDQLKKVGFSLKETTSLPALRMIMSTGSPLGPEAFEYVYAHIKDDLCLASISGGTDILSCFALGNPLKPVWRGELQGPGLGMAVEVYDDQGKSLDQGKGELVCTKPFPSRPLGFWADPKGEKYHQAYYSAYKNTWFHGDYLEKTSQGGLIIHGRSDAVLNPGGVRIGTAEIYRQVEKVPQVLESVVIGQSWDQDERIVLFVRLQEGLSLTPQLKEEICVQIRKNTTPRHVPALVIQVLDIPKTRNGKISELAVRAAVQGVPIKNREALENPESLVFYEDIPELKE